MEHIPSILISVFLALGLAAVIPLNGWIPLLIAVLAAKFSFGTAIIQVNPDFVWILSNQTLAILITAAIIDVIADKIPAVSTVLQTLNFVIRPSLAILLSFVLIRDPVLAGIISIITGSGALGAQIAKFSFVGSTDVPSAGIVSLIRSSIEDVGAVMGSLLVIWLPIIMGTIVFLILIVMLIRKSKVIIFLMMLVGMVAMLIKLLM